MGPDSIMASLSSKLGNPTTLSKLRPQLSGACLVAAALILVALVPFLSFTWHVACILALFMSVDAVAVGNKTYAFFIRIAIFLYIRAPGLKIHMYGDFEEIRRRDENVLYMSNHQSSLDWLLACAVASWSQSLERIRFMMKQELHWVPMVGYYTKAVGHIYVRRKGFKQDKLLESLATIRDMEKPFWLAVFPEGTRYNPDDLKTISASEDFAKQYNERLLKHQLTPRPRGTWLMLKNMRSRMSAVYSVAVVYEQPEPKGHRRKAPSASDILGGKCSDVHLHVRRIPIEDVPEEEEAFMPWLYARSLERDRLLTEYYSTRSFASWGATVTHEGDSLFMDLACLLLMVVSVMVSPFVRTVYTLQAVLGTLYGYAALTIRPTF